MNVIYYRFFYMRCAIYVHNPVQRVLLPCTNTFECERSMAIVACKKRTDVCNNTLHSDTFKGLLRKKRRVLYEVPFPRLVNCTLV